MSLQDALQTLFLEGPAASGRAPSTEGALVYAVGDVHGRYDLLKRLLEQIALDGRRRARGRRPMVVFCGDYIDRGPESGRVLDALIWLSERPDYEVRLLKGNHEAMALTFLEDPAAGGPWMRNGGDATLRAYGVDPPELSAGLEALERARRRFLARMPAAHLFLLQRLEIRLVVGDYFFVHAGVRPGTPLDAQQEEDMLWIRGPFLDAERASEKVVVHGHSWVDDQPAVRPGRIGVDTGAYRTGVLTAAWLDGDEQGFLQASA